MMNIVYSPISTKSINFLPLISPYLYISTLFPQISFFPNLRFLLRSYFDHDAFMHSIWRFTRILDALGIRLILSLCLSHSLCLSLCLSVAFSTILVDIYRATHRHNELTANKLTLLLIDFSHQNYVNIGPRLAR